MLYNYIINGGERIDILIDFYVFITDANRNDFPQPFSTALFSFLYHLASYESGNFYSYYHFSFHFHAINHCFYSLLSGMSVQTI